MQVEKLQATVSELEEQLRDSSLDDASRRALEQEIDQIRAALQANQTQTQRQSLIERLNAAAESFGGAHPTLAGTLMRLIDGLGEMGI